MIHSTTNYIHHKKPSLAKAKSSNTGYGKPIHPDMTKFGITSGHTETSYKLYLLIKTIMNTDRTWKYEQPWFHIIKNEKNHAITSYSITFGYCDSSAVHEHNQNNEPSIITSI